MMPSTGMPVVSSQLSSSRVRTDEQHRPAAVGRPQRELGDRPGESGDEQIADAGDAQSGEDHAARDVARLARTAPPRPATSEPIDERAEDPQRAAHEREVERGTQARGAPPAGRHATRGRASAAFACAA